VPLEHELLRRERAGQPGIERSDPETSEPRHDTLRRGPSGRAAIRLPVRPAAAYGAGVQMENRGRR
ncbi:hypothetical protein, partial [Catellatospora sp. NPDC049609]|uniref:hypothetical protein n=1 Tax=Catellatospora sp. NPDC049609 TaxID=3155505 RepID=UPI00342B750E